MNSLRFTLLGLLAGLGAGAPVAAETGGVEPVRSSDITKFSSSPASANPAPASTNPVFDYTQDNLVADLAQQLTERYRVTGELQVDLLRAWNPPHVTEPLSLIVLEAPPVLGSALLVRFRLLAGARSVAETSILVRVQLIREVWCARAPTERGTSFDPAQFDTRRVDTLRERDTIATSEATGDLTLVRTVSTGRVLTWHDVARRSLVRKGQVIDVCAVSGTLTVSMKGLAMENGTAGETIRVRNIDSKKEFPAIVIADSRAEVRL